MDKLELMDIDYKKAMEFRAEVHQSIEEQRNEQKKVATVSLDAIAGIKQAKKETRPVLIAVATEGQGVINQHFGHAKEFLVYEASSNGVRFVGPRKVEQYCIGSSECDDGESKLSMNIRTLVGCEAVLCAKIGLEPWGQLEEAGIEPNGEHAYEPIEEAVAAVYLEMVANGKVDIDVQQAQKASA
jgi:nitrogen fixation protein NifB